MIDNYQCRTCGSLNTNFLGELPKQTHFANKKLDHILPQSGLYKCNSCFILVRHPILSIPDYNNLYETASSKVWTTKNINLRQDQIIIKDLVLNNFKSACKVLDVGCYTGDLLAALPRNFSKYGIEMSKDAANVAIEKGINIIGNNLYDINTSCKFDLILAVDVIEHTQNPEEFLNELATLLDVDGRVIISTGNTDNWLWRYLKNRFWYSKFPEHISFIGDNWLDTFCRKNKFILTHKQNFSYTSISVRSLIKNMSKLLLSLLHIYPERFSNSTKDHFCFIIKKV